MPYALNITNFYDYDVKQVTETITNAKKEGQKVLPILVNSYGGSVYNCLRMVDALKASGMKLVTLLNGYAMSAGSIIFALGEERYMSENSTIMIHEVSSWSMGKNADMKSAGKHTEELQNKLFSILDKQSGQKDGFFLDLINQNKNADLFLNAEQAKEYGLVTEIKIPSPEEILNSNQASFIPRNPWESMRFFMQYVPENNIASEKDSKAENKPNQNQKTLVNSKNTNIAKSKEVKMDLEELLAMLTNEQKAPIIALQNQIKTKDKEVENLTTSLDAKTKELASVIEANEKKLADIETANDKSFLDSLKASGQLAQADYDSELEVLNSLNSNAKAKASYKAKLSASAKVVPNPVGINEQNIAQDLGKQIVAYAQKHGLNLAKDYDKARNAVLNGGK